MERVRTIIVAAGLLLPVSLTGCATTPKTTANAAPQSAWEQFQTRVQKVAGTEPPPPAATDFACAWQNRLQQLPDPSRGGQMTTGIAGQVFLYTRAAQQGDADYAAAEINGDLVVVVSDATPRPGTMKPLESEVWHFTKETLKKMVVTDERFGKSIVLFLPWPDTWKDVRSLSIQARYDQAAGTTLFAQPMALTLDVNNQYGTGMVTNSTTGPMFSGVPDPKMVMQKMSTPTGTTAIQQTGAWSPPPATMTARNPVFDAPPPGSINPRDPIFASPPPSMTQQGLYAPPPASSTPTSPQADFRAVIKRQ